MIEISFIFKYCIIHNVFRDVTRQMEDKFKKYCKYTPLLFTTTTILSTRNKLLTVQNLFEVISDNLLETLTFK